MSQMRIAPWEMLPAGAFYTLVAQKHVEAVPLLLTLLHDREMPDRGEKFICDSAVIHDHLSPCQADTNSGKE